MRRSVRNGLAIAGMAGGMWFLGQAVAQADQANDVGQDSTTRSRPASGGGVGGNIGGNANESDATSVDIDVSTDVDGGDGGRQLLQRQHRRPGRRPSWSSRRRQPVRADDELGSGRTGNHVGRRHRS